LALLASGAAAADTVRLLVATDEEQEVRQLHLMDRMGRFSAHTGAKCEEWCGHLVKETYSVAGNILTGAHVLEAMAAAYEAGGELPLAQRLLAVMQAAEQADGDKRGKQSAALLIHGNEDWALLDLRIDDHADPLSELGRLEQLARSA
jgi:uncharacterized Ntn-hydrolase superfamily protein